MTVVSHQSPTPSLIKVLTPDAGSISVNLTSTNTLQWKSATYWVFCLIAYEAACFIRMRELAVYLELLCSDDAAFLEFDHSKCSILAVIRHRVFVIGNVAAYPIRRKFGLAVDGSRQQWICTECLIHRMKKIECRRTDDVAFVRMVDSLTITKSLAIGNSRGAQLIVCNIAPKASSATPFRAVAKIFDPLYYSFLDKIVRMPVDTSLLADQDYSREADAYEHLRKVGLAGSFAPRYFGSWTFNLRIVHANHLQIRPVRLVLIEHVDGSSLRDLYTKNKPGPNADLDALHYNKEYRLEVLARVLEGVAKQRHAGLNQRDLAPRNVIVVPRLPEKPAPGKAPPLLRVVLVDYNISVVYEKTKYGKPPFMSAKLPRSPMESYWNESLPEFAGWIPPEWYENPKLRQQWLRHRYGESKEFATPQLE